MSGISFDLRKTVTSLLPTHPLSSPKQSTYKSYISLQSTFWRYILFIDLKGENRNCLPSIQIDAQHIYVPYAARTHTSSTKCLFDTENTHNFLVVWYHTERGRKERRSDILFPILFTKCDDWNVPFQYFRSFACSIWLEKRMLFWWNIFSIFAQKKKRKLIAARLMTILKILWWQSSARSEMWTNERTNDGSTTREQVSERMSENCTNNYTRK